MASVTLTGVEYDELKNARRDAENQVADLRHQLAAAKLISGDPFIIAALTEITRKALDVVRFAVGNLPPETVVGWPSPALREIAVRLPMLPNYSPDDAEVAGELIGFAQDCERWARYRAQDHATRSAPAVVSGLPAPLPAAEGG